MYFSIRPPTVSTRALAASPEVFATIRQLKSKGITLLLIEPFAKSALEVADNAYVMERGATAVAGTPEELRRDQRVLEAYLG